MHQVPLQLSLYGSFCLQGRSEPFEHGNVSGDALTIFPNASNERTHQPMNHDQPLSQSSKPRSHKGCRCSQRDTSCLTGIPRSTHGSPQGRTVRTRCYHCAGSDPSLDTSQMDQASNERTHQPMHNNQLQSQPKMPPCNRGSRWTPRIADPYTVRLQLLSPDPSGLLKDQQPGLAATTMRDLVNRWIRSGWIEDQRPGSAFTATRERRCQ